MIYAAVAYDKEVYSMGVQFCPLNGKRCESEMCAWYVTNLHPNVCAAVVIAESLHSISEHMERKARAAEREAEYAEAAYRLQAELANPL